MNGTGTLIEAINVRRVYQSGDQQVVAVNDLSVTMRQGEFLALVGRSGSGKTTLLNMLSGLDKPTSGTITFEGKDFTRFSDAEMVTLRRRKIGFVFQSFGLLPLLSAYENVELPLRINGIGGKERKQRVDEVLAQVQLGKRVHHRPFELSGGEQQRVALARALVTKPFAIFADEPTGELDSLTGMTITNLLRDVTTQQNITVIVATHDLRLAGMTERILEMEDGKLTRVSKPVPA